MIGSGVGSSRLIVWIDGEFCGLRSGDVFVSGLGVDVQLMKGV